MFLSPRFYCPFLTPVFVPTNATNLLVYRTVAATKLYSRLLMAIGCRPATLAAYFRCRHPSLVDHKVAHIARCLDGAFSCFSPLPCPCACVCSLALISTRSKHTWRDNMQGTSSAFFMVGGLAANCSALRILRVFMATPPFFVSPFDEQSFLGSVEARLERSRLLIERLRKEEAKEKKTQLAMTVSSNCCEA